MEWDVVDVKPIAPLVQLVKFANGIMGKVQFEPSHLSGVFETLKDSTIFQLVCIENGAVGWPGNLDLAPDAMYKAIKTTGEWVLK